MMSELLAKVAELLGAPETLVQRSAEARAEASGNTVEEILQSWAGGEAIAASALKEEPAEEVKEEVVVAEEKPAEEVKEEVVVAEEVKEEVVVAEEEPVTKKLVEEKSVELKNESSLVFIAGVISVAIFTYFFAFVIPKNQSADLVAESLNNEIVVSQEVLKGAQVYNNLNCQSCHTQNVRLLIPDSQNGKILRNKFANETIIKNTGLLRLGPDLTTSATREPTNNRSWLSRYLEDSASVRDKIPHPNYDFLIATDLDYLLTYLLSLGEVNE
jgi:cbb3-type cytochrome oxidase cytochrome c subunit